MTQETGAVQAQGKIQNPESLTEALQKFIGRPTGLQFPVEGLEGTAAFFDGRVTNVKVNSAWIAFTIGECMFRTKSETDAKALWEWVLKDGVGSLTARFQKSCGCTSCKHLASAEVKEEKPMPITPRSARRFGRLSSDDFDRMREIIGYQA